MPLCKANSCRVGSGSSSAPQATRHRFPKDENGRNKWLRAIGQPNLELRDYDFVCSLHFCESDYDEITPDMWGRMPKMKTRRLKDSAVPSQNLHLPPVSNFT